MFPGANATVYRNEAGEPLGWSYEHTEAEYDYDAIAERDNAREQAWEIAEDQLFQELADDEPEPDPETGEWQDKVRKRADEILRAWRDR